MFFIQQIILDSAREWQLGFQDPATPIMEGIIDLHHHIFFFLIMISFFVLWMTSFIIIRFARRHGYLSSPSEDDTDDFPGDNGSEGHSDSDLDVKNEETKKSFWFFLKPTSFMNSYMHTMYVVHGTTLELIWTVIPTFILLAIAVPSFSLLYSIDEVIDPMITVKIIGHQWYWSYELSDFSLRNLLMLDDFMGVNFDSYMLPEEELSIGDLRLLEVDNFLLLPTKVHIRLLITSSDVIHAWAVPSLGVKVDAVPGRLNQASLFIKRPGFFYGQCSELCGVNHGFMPICVVASDNMNDFADWLLSVSI